MRAWLSYLLPSPKSPLGFLAYLIIFIKPILSVLSFLGNVDLVTEYITPIGNFLATGWGTAVLIATGFVLLAYVDYRRRSEEAQRANMPQVEPTEETEPDQEAESLSSRLQESEQERERLERELASRGDAGKVWGPTITQEDSSAVIQRLQAENTRSKETQDALKEENQRLHAERDASGQDDEDLKQRSLELSDELFGFLEERGEQDPQNTRWLANATDDQINEYSQATTRYSNETMSKYRRRFSGKVRALVADLKQRGWWNLEDLEPKERQRLESPLHPISVQAIAERLSAIGHK